MNIKYVLSFPNPDTHYLEVEMHLSDVEQASLNLKMAVWTPGSYLIREFQKNIDNVVVFYPNNENKRLEKINKNTWTLDTKQEKELVVKYKIYCFEYSVRTNLVDDSHALLNGAGTFIYVEGFEKDEIEININPFEKWDKISTSLAIKNGNKWQRIAENLDDLIDSPIEIGNHETYFFEAANVPHELAIYGTSNCNILKLMEDLIKIIEVETAIFGSHPCKNYVFIIHNTDTSYGGLEHKNSSVNHIPRWSYDDTNYQRAISLLAHEYFHLWNVKRIKPASLIPYNYEKENYTDLLWFFEGVTSFYDDYVCYKAGVTSKEKYIEIVENNLNEVLNTAGKDTQTLAEASYDTWLKYYRKNENSSNAQINYYTHGAVVTMLFNFYIIYDSNGEKKFEDVLKKMYDAYLSNPNKGITKEDIIQIITSFTNSNFDEFYTLFIESITSFKGIDPFFKMVGIELTNQLISGGKYLGITTKLENGRLLITQLDKKLWRL
ncbi:MAG TPA: hypothetical protein PLT17_05180 [Chitinophagales bacterium]|nr:hypothetical protein [Chitinophagales bacterium]